MYDKEVELNGNAVAARLPLWCWLLGIWLVMASLGLFAIGMSSLVAGLRTPATTVLEPGQNTPLTDTAIGFVFSFLCGVPAIIVLRGGFKRTWTIVTYCTFCRIPFDHSLSMCTQCGGPLKRVSVGRARASIIKQGSMALRGELSKAASERKPDDHAIKEVSHHPTREFVDLFISHVEEDSDYTFHLSFLLCSFPPEHGAQNDVL